MKKSRAMLAVPLAFALTVAACGSDDDGDSEESASTEAAEAPAEEPAEEPADEPAEEPADEPAEEPAEEPTGDDGVAAAQAFVDQFLEPPTEIGPTIPLDGIPEAKTVAWLECSLPSCIAIGEGFKEATDLLGWNLEVISWSTDAAAAFQQAIDQGVDYVAITGTAPALIQDQLDTAAEAGIPLMSCFDTAIPDPENNNIWTQCGDATAVVRAGNLLGNAIIADSGGTANVMMVNIPDFEVLKSEREGSEQAYAENCPDTCTFTELPLTLDQLLAGEVPGAVVSALQADPDIDYIHLAFDGLAGGLTTTLAEADLLEGRKVVGVDYNGVILQEIVDGTMQFWTTNPKEYSAWIMIDAMARHALGMDNPEERDNALLPTFIVNSPEVAEPLIPTDGWQGPDDMAEQFAALWGV